MKNGMTLGQLIVDLGTKRSFVQQDYSRHTGHDWNFDDYEGWYDYDMYSYLDDIFDESADNVAEAAHISNRYARERKIAVHYFYCKPPVKAKKRP